MASSVAGAVGNCIREQKEKRGGGLKERTCGPAQAVLNGKAPILRAVGKEGFWYRSLVLQDG